MSTAQQFVNKALSYEGRSDSRYFIEQYNNFTGRGIPYGSDWCAMFVTVVARQCGVSTKEIPNYEGCITGERLFRALNRWKDRRGYTPRTGDVVIFDWDKENNNGNDHTGIVVSCSNGMIYTIEGNAGNNGVCMRRSYSMSNSTIVGYGTPIFTKEEEDMTKAETEKIAQDKADAAKKAAVAEAQALIADYAKNKDNSRIAYVYLSDMPEYYATATEWAMKKGIVQGTGKDSKGVTKIEMTKADARSVTMLYRFENETMPMLTAAVEAMDKKMEEITSKIAELEKLHAGE